MAAPDAPDPAPRLKPLSEVVPLEKAVPCPECGGYCFFDWGLKFLHRASFGASPRLKDYSDFQNVQICASCLHPIVRVDGDYYDASEFVSREAIEKILARGQAREHRTPVPSMDP